MNCGISLLGKLWQMQPERLKHLVLTQAFFAERYGSHWSKEPMTLFPGQMTCSLSWDGYIARSMCGADIENVSFVCSSAHHSCDRLEEGYRHPLKGLPSLERRNTWFHKTFGSSAEGLRQAYQEKKNNIWNIHVLSTTHSRTVFGSGERYLEQSRSNVMRCKNKYRDTECGL